MCGRVGLLLAAGPGTALRSRRCARGLVAPRRGARGGRAGERAAADVCGRCGGLLCCECVICGFNGELFG